MYKCIKVNSRTHFFSPLSINKNFSIDDCVTFCMRHRRFSMLSLAEEIAMGEEIVFYAELKHFAVDFQCEIFHCL